MFQCSVIFPARVEMFLLTSLLIFCTKMLLCLSRSVPSWVSLCDEGLLLTVLTVFIWQDNARPCLLVLWGVTGVGGSPGHVQPPGRVPGADREPPREQLHPQVLCGDWADRLVVELRQWPGDPRGLCPGHRGGDSLAAAVGEPAQLPGLHGSPAPHWQGLRWGSLEGRRPSEQQ